MKRGALLVLVGALSASGAERLELTLKKAVEVALAPDGSTRTRLTKEVIQQTEARSRQARGALLPNVEGAVADQSMTRNLAAFGIQVQIPIPGFQFPQFVGPFTVFDARASVTQNLFDISSIQRFKASRAMVSASRADDESARIQVSNQVARAYLTAVRARASLDTAEANVALADTLVRLAESQKAAGTGTGIEIVRARVQLANEKQRLSVAGFDKKRADLALLRLINTPLDTTLDLTERLGYAPSDPATLQAAIEIANGDRAESRAQQNREEAARLSLSAAKFERLPTLVGFADYGSSGSGLDNAQPTRAIGVSLRIPIFDGGRREARRTEALSALRQESIRTGDLQVQIEMEVRVALDALQSAESQVQTAAEGLALAEEELAQAKRRYEAGVTSNLEVTEAQTRLQRARDNQIAALFGYNLAQIELQAAMGKSSGN